MKVQGNRYINNPEMIKNKVEKKTTVPQNIISEDDVKISDSARKLVETARNKVSDFHTMHFSSIMGEIREIPAEYKCENLFKLDLKATSISGEQSAFEGCSENQSEVFEKWLDENASEYLTEDEMKDLKEKINAMTADVDFLNAQEGYRGTSYELRIMKKGVTIKWRYQIIIAQQNYGTLRIKKFLNLLKKTNGN